MVDGDVPLVVCVSADPTVRERVVRRLDDCGAVVLCADLTELRALLFPGQFVPPTAPAPVPAGPLSGVPTPPGGIPPVVAYRPIGLTGEVLSPALSPPAVATLPAPAPTPWSVPPPRRGPVPSPGLAATYPGPPVEEADPTVPAGPIRLGELTIDAAGHLVTWRGEPLALTRLERAVLAVLASPPVAVWTYEQLFGSVWGGAYLGDTAILHSAMKRLRRKLRAADDDLRVQTVRGVGYRLAVPN